MPTPETQLMYFIQALEDKFKDKVHEFKGRTDQRTNEMNYQPNIVLDEGEDDDDDLEWAQ